MNPFHEFKQAYNEQKKQKQQVPGKLIGFLKSLGVIAGAVIVLIIILSSFMFTVGEREQVVITQFEEIVRVIVDEDSYEAISAELKGNPRFANVKIQKGRGLFFKIPLIQQVKRFPNQLLTYDTKTEEVFTLDKKTIMLDNYAQWRISNPALFMVSIGNISQANQRIDEFIYSKMREEIGKIDAFTLVADKDYVYNMLQNVEGYINSQMEAMGIRIMDIRIKRTEYPDATKPSIYEQMRSERQAVATQYRADGQKRARTITAEAQRKATVIEAQAYEEAQKIRGEGDAEALRIYAEAYNIDPEFYSFWETLKAYSSVIDEDTTIIIDSGSPFARYLFGE
ncbi:MAG TPA: protease modulator HflC [Thermoclostridium sp.]|nr:protease modulator HflC [Clostridiaceae bacterium]HOQ76411.1 protease modulator HflC [Thermoclostridium sp.]